MKDMEWIKTGLIAHRGLHTSDGKVPENTKLAFEKAIEKGYGIECDINVLKDGTVVVFHDGNLKRLCGKDKFLRDLTFDDLKDERIMGTEEKILSLKQMLDFVAGRVPLLIELKPFTDQVQLCENFMKTMEGYQGQWAIHAFHPGTVGWFRKHHPEVIRGQITEFFRDDPNMSKVTKYLMKTMALNLFTKPDFINYGVKDLPNKYADRAKRRGYVVIGYASRNQEQFDMMRTRYDNSVFEFFLPKVNSTKPV